MEVQSTRKEGGGEPLSPFEFMNECKAATSSAPEIPRREGGIPGRRGGSISRKREWGDRKENSTPKT